MDSVEEAEQQMMTRGKMMTETICNITEESKMADHHERNMTCLKQRSFNKLKLLAGGSIAAAVIAITSAPASVKAQAFNPVAGQAFQASATSPTGGVIFDGPRTTNLDSLLISTPEVVINWQPLDTNAAVLGPDGLPTNPINILPSGRTLRFSSASSDYTILNRILPNASAAGRPIEFNGAVESFTNGNPGGNIWFYSPGGIIVGSTGRFDVGNLVLTANDIDTTDGFFGANNEIRFRGTENSTSAVSVTSGAQINALQEDSYVALVAPRVVQGGTVTVNGSAAYVAAEQADLIINTNNLFSIEIPLGAGTTDENGIVHSGTGTTNGPAPLDNADKHHVYMVAVPKNQAMTMLLSGSIGQDLAVSAFVEDSRIILSAGGNVSNTSFNNTIDKTIDPALNGNISISGADFTGGIDAFANNRIDIFATSGGDVVQSLQSIYSQLDFTSGNSIGISASGGGNIDFAGDMTFNTTNRIDFAVGPGSQFSQVGNLSLNAFTDTQGGIVDIDITGPGALTTGSGQLIVDGTFNILAGVIGTESRRAVVDNGTDTFGGTINVDIISGGLLDISGGADFDESTFDASASPHLGLVSGADSFGGTINFNIDGAGSTLVADGFFGLELYARGNSTSTFNGTSTGGSGTGGAVNLIVNGGTITASRLELDASADGSSSASGNTTESINSAFSGNVVASFTDALINIDELTLLTGADAARSIDSAGNLITANASGGDLTLTFDNTIFNADVMAINASPFGASGTALSGEVAAGEEGSATFNLLNGSVVTVLGQFRMFGRGRSDIDGSSSSVDLDLLINNATLNAATVSLDNSRTTDSPAGSPEGTPSSINVTIENGGALNAGILSVNSSALAGAAGGQATAGDINLLVDGGSLILNESSATSLFMDARGLGANNDGSGATSDTGLGIGGNIVVTLQGGGTMTMNSARFSSDGLIVVPGDGVGFQAAGEGGSGLGGSVTFNLNGSTFAATELTISASGVASDGGNSSTTVVGNGGTGTGGNVIFNLRGTDVIVNNLTVNAEGIGGGGGNSRETEGEPAGDGGQGVGGSAIFNANSGSLTVSNSLTISSGGFGGQGGTGEGVDAGNGGDSIGGIATFTLDGTADVDIGTGGLIVNANTTGGDGGFALVGNSPAPTPSPARNAGNGGNAIAGTATYNNLSGAITFNDLYVTSIGAGGTAGMGGTLTFNNQTFIYDFTESFVGQTGSNGGNGTGGNAIINLGQDDSNPIQYSVDASGTGTAGSDGITGGVGGNGIGGSAIINVIDATVILDNPTITANGFGGRGGNGNRDSVASVTGDSGNGSNGIGGTARLEVTGAGSNIDLSSIILEANATGGAGGAGFYQFGGGINGGNAGSGGNANGGTVEIIARTGAMINITTSEFNMTSTGTGGAGGNGGNSYDSDSGDGGNGGNATGGTARLLAQGATISGNNLTITTSGQGGNGGIRGIFGATGTNGTSGIGGNGTGGTGIIAIQEGSPGIITLGDVQIAANGFNAGDISLPTGFGGRIEITDTSADPAGLISFGSLNAEALAVAGPMSGFFMSGNSGIISATGDIVINVAGNAEFTYDGDGQLIVDGFMDVNSGASILVSHSNNALSIPSIDVAGTFDARAQEDFNSATGSIINSASTVSIRAEGNGSAADLRAFTNIDLSAGRNALLDNATVNGPPITLVVGADSFLVSGISVSAGGDGGSSFELFDPSFNATLTGDIASSGAIRVEAGGNAIFQTGANVVSDNILSVRTGDDIIIQSGASVTAANNPLDTPNTITPFDNINNLLLLAGDIGTVGQLFTTPLTPIASIIAAGDINANGFAVIMTAGAIDGLGGTISAGSISADINNAPSNAVITAIGQSDDAGLLSANCLEGNLCLGALSADNIVEIGQFGVPVQAIIENGDIFANRILVSTRRDIVMGADGIASRFIASDEIFVNSTEGNVNLKDAELTSGTIGIEAAGSLLGSGSLNSGNDIGITVSDSISAATINTSGELTTVTARGGALERFYSVPGSMNVSILTVGVGDVNYDAGGDLSFDQINVPDTDIFLTAPGSIFVGGTSGAQNIDIDGDSIVLGGVGGAGDITLTAASFIDFGTVSAGNFLGIAASTISGDSADGSDIVMDADFISVNRVAGGNLDAVAQQDLAFNNIDITGNANLDALDQAVVGNGDVNGNLVLTGAGVALDSGNIGGNLTMYASAGDIDGNGIIDVGGTIDLDATGNIGFGSLAANGGDFTADAGGDIEFANAFAAGDILFNAINILGGNIVSDQDIVISVESIRLGNATTAGLIDLTSSVGDIVAATLDAGNTINVSAAGDAVISNVISINETRLRGSSVNLGGADTGDNGDPRFTVGLSVSASDGDVTIGGDLDISRLGAFGATGNIVFADLDITSKLPARVTVSAQDSIIFGNVTSDRSITAGATNDFTATSVTAPELRVTVSGIVTIETAQGGALRVTGDQDININNIIADSALLLSSDGDVSVRNNAAVSDLLTATGNNVLLRSDGALRVSARATTGTIDIVTVGNLVVDDADAAGNVRLTSLSGNAELNDVISLGASFGMSPTGITGQATTSANGNIDITAAGDVLINSETNAANALTITAGNLIDIQALTTGTTINLSSADIDIGPDGQLGDFVQTNDIFIQSNGINQAILGGAGTTGLFSLSNDEFSRIQSNQDLTIFITETGNITPDLTIQDLTVRAGDNISGPQSATLGFAGTLTINSGQSTRVDGNLNLANASGSTVLNMTSQNDLRINANGGLIQMTDANGGFGNVGLMTLTAQNIYVLTNQAYNDIFGLDLAAINQRLANNDGVDIDRGFIRGGFAEFVVDGDLFIQNSAPVASFDARRGFTVSSLTVNGRSASSNANIVINGVIDGVTGIDTIPVTNIGVGFNSASTINGCLIANPASCGTPAPTPTPAGNPRAENPVQDIIEEEVAPDEDGSLVSDPFETNLIELKETEEFIDDPLIDEPVTGAGNDDLWVSEEDTSGEDTDTCESGDETCNQDSPADKEALESAE
ncbi:MAG: hypothetical protein V7676_08130 [Parasphingorhabdus sp.]|uniref:beta strand repeat-containing protein n=1 Tax=Parasphingorhabdus sp. TaxID=2709688 RepID=UPI0030018E13